MIHKHLLLPSFLLFSALLSAQQEKQSFAYAITAAAGNNNSGWTEVRVINMGTGSLEQNVFESAKQYDIFSARSGKRIQVNAVDMLAKSKEAPMATFSAACAFDKKHNRLYYTPMGISQLRYVDLSTKTPRFFYFDTDNFGIVKDLNDAANHITRMTFAADGNGYALTNDGHHLISFTTGRKPVITDLGAITDDAANNGLSVHNQCTGWGGDMVGDALGNLYLIAATQAVFKINLQNKVATYLGHIKGLPQNFTTNGAAVDEEGKLVVSSANSTAGYYEVDLLGLNATAYTQKAVLFTTSDLASGNLLFKKDNKAKAEPIALLQTHTTALSKISVYPNPVTEGIVNISFDKLDQGRYMVQVIDQNGAMIHQQQVITTVKGQLARVEMDAAVAKGIYLVKVIAEKNKEVQTTKIIVQ